MPKYHEIIENNDVAKAVNIARLLIEIENIVDEVATEHQVEIHKYRIEGLEDMGGNEIKVYIDLDAKCSKEITVGGTLIKVVCKQTLPNIVEVYRRVATRLAKISVDLLRHFLTREEEYMVVFIDRSYAVLLEGSPEKVVAPSIPGTLFICHTHPNTTRALFSKEDIRSLLELLSNRGLGGCIISAYSYLIIYRCGPFTLDDYFKLFKAVKEQEYIDIATLKSLGLESIEGIELAI
ncbi:MAG: hypothetical protein QXL96_05625 [Ignisphaera sp.]